MYGVDGEAFVACGHGGDDVGLCGLDCSLSFVAAVELVVRGYDLEVDTMSGEVADHGFADDVVADMEGEKRRQVWEPGGVLLMKLFVFGDIVRVGGAGRHGDDVNHLETRHHCYEDAVLFVDNACRVGVERAFEIEGREAYLEG